MKKNYHLDDFEAYLSDSADQHRMYPSDRVWRNIDKELHGQKKWPALTFGAVLTGAIITAGLILIHPAKNLLQIDPQQQSVPAGQNNKSVPDQASNGIDNQNARDNRTALAQTVPSLHEAPINNQPSIGYYDFNNAASDDNIHGLNTEDANPLVVSNSDNFEDYKILTPLNGVYQSGVAIAYPNAGISIAAAEVDENGVVSVGNIATPNQAVIVLINNEQSGEQVSPLNKDIKKNRWSMEYYVTPSYSYRYLTETKITDLHQAQSNGPIAPNLINAVNNFVSHKPTLGLELGAGVVYQASSKLQIKAGLQFNVRGYTIEAFAAGVEPSTIVLNRGFYTDSIFALSSYSTQSGYKDVNIENRYWQVSVPIGINYQVTDGKKLNLSIAASAQPTYQFNNSEYILSHDYRNYVQEPSLVRKWNLNTAIGANISYQTKNVTWQAGPQIRYQALSGTVKEYPIREHLLDYGFRIGVVKTLK
jgi:hypothetical protein